VDSALFPRGGINDVVEASGTSIYVTQWQQFSFPAGGKGSPATLMETLQMLMDVPRFLLDLRLTRVIECRWQEGSDAAPTCTLGPHAGARAPGSRVARPTRWRLPRARAPTVECAHAKGSHEGRAPGC